MKVTKSVTKTQIQEISKKYFNPDQAIVLVVGNKAILYKTLMQLCNSKNVEIYDSQGNILKEDSLKTIPDSLTSKMIIDKYIHAIGGRENIEKIKDISIYSTTNTNGMEIKQTVYKKNPDKYSINMSLNEVSILKQSFNGKRAIIKNFQGERNPSEIEFENIKMNAAICPELNYEDLGITTSLINVEKVNKTGAYKVEIYSPSGQKKYDYFSVESGLKIQSEEIVKNTQGEFSQKQEFSDYRTVEDVISSGIQNMELKVDSVCVNKDLNDDLF